MEVLDHKCISCGAKLPFNPKTQKWDCPYCGRSYELKELQEYEKNHMDEYEVEKETENDGEEVDMDMYTCPDCGAEIIADKNTSATFCVYCGNTSIIKKKFQGKFKPMKLIPFKNTKKEAIAKFKALGKGKMFTPKDFLDEKNIEKIEGVYIPFWLYDYDVSGSVEMEGTKSTTWHSGDYRYEKIDTYGLHREGKMEYRKVPADGSTKFDDNTMDSVEPFDYNGLVDFNMSYLSGFFSEKYDLNADDTKSRVLERITNSTKNQFISTGNGYSGVKVVSSKLNAENLACNYVLLPVWMLNIKYQDKMHFFAMNGQTGKMVGNIPIDKKKLNIARILSFGISFIVAFLAILLFTIIF